MNVLYKVINNALYLCIHKTLKVSDNEIPSVHLEFKHDLLTNVKTNNYRTVNVFYKVTGNASNNEVFSSKT